MTRVYQLSPYQIPRVNLRFELFSHSYLRVKMAFDYTRTSEENEPLFLYSHGVNTVQIILPEGASYEAHFRPANHRREDSYLILRGLPRTGQVIIYSHLNPSLNSPQSGLYLDAETLILDGNKEGLWYATYFLPSLMPNFAQLTTQVIARQIPHPAIDISGKFITEDEFEYSAVDQARLKYAGIFKFIPAERLAGKWYSQTWSSSEPTQLTQFNLRIITKPFPALLRAYQQHTSTNLIPTVHAMVPPPAHSPGIII